MSLLVKPDSGTLRKQIWHGSLALGLRLFGGFAINVLGNILLARILGPRIWGIYAVSLFLQLTYQTLFEKGLVAYLVQKQGPISSIELSVSYTIQVGIGLLCLVASGLLLPFLAIQWLGYGELALMLFSASIAGFAYSLRSVPLALLERELKYVHVGIIEIGDILAFNAVALACVLLGWGIVGLAIGNIARGLTSMIIGFGVTRNHKPQLSWDMQVARRILGFGIPVFGSNFLKILASAADTVLVSLLAGPQTLGFVQVTYTLLNYPAYLSAILTRVSFSALSRIQDQVEDLGQLSSLSVGLLSRVIMPLMAGLAGTAPLWIPWLYGTEWLPVARALWVAAIPMALGHTLLSLTAPLYAKGQAREVVLFLACYVLTYAVASYLLIPRWAELGSPIALWVSLPLWIILIRAYVKHCGVFDFWSLGFVLLTSVLMMLALSLTVELHWSSLVIGLIVIFAVWWLAISNRALARNGISLRRLLSRTISVRSLD